MIPFEVESVLESMSVIADTREQDTEQARKRYKRIGVPVERGKLDFGDYTYNCTLLDGRRLYDVAHPIHPKCVIERKMSLDELAMCFTRDRDRFRREFERAKTQGAKVYLLVEGMTWENLILGKYRSKFSAKAFLASLTAYMVRYGVSVVPCKAETSGRMIKEILYRDLKERLTDGRI